MRIKTCVTIVIIILGLQYSVNAQDCEKILTIYLIRHAEKDLSAENSKDPPLSQCGHQRAVSIASFLEGVDVDAIYSTDYIRTKSTAQPTARKKGIEVKIYNPQELNDFAKLLVERQEDALVVGHSNTTGVLAGQLVGEKIGLIDENIYNRIYQVVIYKNTGRLHILHSSCICNN